MPDDNTPCYHPIWTTHFLQLPPRLLRCNVCCRPGHTGFNNAERRLWRDELFGTQILGYLKTHKHLTHLIIRNAGHMVSMSTWILHNTGRVGCRLGGGGWLASCTLLGRAVVMQQSTQQRPCQVVRY
jgi:hypothetical protein